MEMLSLQLLLYCIQFQIIDNFCLGQKIQLQKLKERNKTPSGKNMDISSPKFHCYFLQVPIINNLKVTPYCILKSEKTSSVHGYFVKK